MGGHFVGYSYNPSTALDLDLYDAARGRGVWHEQLFFNGGSAVTSSPDIQRLFVSPTGWLAYTEVQSDNGSGDGGTPPGAASLWVRKPKRHAKDALVDYGVLSAISFAKPNLGWRVGGSRASLRPGDLRGTGNGANPPPGACALITATDARALTGISTPTASPSSPSHCAYVSSDGSRALTVTEQPGLTASVKAAAIKKLTADSTLTERPPDFNLGVFGDLNFSGLTAGRLRVVFLRAMTMVELSLSAAKPKDSVTLDHLSLVAQQRLDGSPTLRRGF